MITAAAIKRVDAGEAVLIDVRSTDEYAAEHAAGARHIDVERLAAGYDPSLPKDTQIYLYCRSGGRASHAESILEDMGYQNVANLGGLCSWAQAGGKTVPGSA